MIWVNISNVLKANKFNGIARTEYELCLYAYKLYEEGYPIRFSTFDVCFGFIQINDQKILDVLYNLKNGCVPARKRLKFKQKFNRSILKRINSFKIFCGVVSYCFNNNDVIISVGQNLYSSEIMAFGIIKNKIDIKLKFLCHDLIPINYPQFSFKRNTGLFLKYINQVTKVADHFYCNSEFTKNELIEYYSRNNLEQPPMQVVTLGCDLYLKEILNKKDEMIQQIVSKPYLLFVSTIEIRKNHNLVYEMYLKLLEQGFEDIPKIYFVGRRGWKVDLLLENLDQDNRIKDKIVILDNVSDSELIRLYKNCWFTLYPSFIEGYGLPVAESLSFGKYCLSSNTGSLTEVGGSFIDYADPYQLDQWVEKFLFLINNPEYIQVKEQKIRDKYSPTSWEECSREILDAELVYFKKINTV